MNIDRYQDFPLYNKGIPTSTEKPNQNKYRISRNQLYASINIIEPERKYSHRYSKSFFIALLKLTVLIKSHQIRRSY